MSATTRNLMITSTAALLALMATIGATEAAQRSQKHHDNDGQKYSRNVDVRHDNNNNRRNRHFRRSIGGIYLSLDNGGGCSYSYRKWKTTGSQYWRARYYDCRNG